MPKSPEVFIIVGVILLLSGVGYLTIKWRESHTNYLQCCTHPNDCYKIEGAHFRQHWFGTGWTVDGKYVATPPGGWCQEKSVLNPSSKDEP